MVDKKIKVVSLFDEGSVNEEWRAFVRSLQSEVSTASFTEHSSTDVSDIKELKAIVDEYDVIFVDLALRLLLSRLVTHRSVGSHFLQYFDYIEKAGDKWWGKSLYTEIFNKTMLQAIHNQDYKGAVLFLGSSPNVLPIVEVLARFGFVEFVFLDFEENREQTQSLMGQLSPQLGTTFRTINPDDFIQSQQEYSLCFVLKDDYSQQVLDDMSYFHFLSNRSIVFDLVGNSNFLFDEVVALGVELVTFDSFKAFRKEVYLEQMGKLIEKSKD